MNPDDVIRDQLLRFLYQRHKKSKGINSIPLGIRELQTEMRALHGLKQQEVSSNLDYLLQVGWVREVTRDRKITTARGMELNQEQIKYKISDVGINHIESTTMFKRPEAIGSINRVRFRS